MWPRMYLIYFESVTAGKSTNYEFQTVTVESDRKYRVGEMDYVEGYGNTTFICTQCDYIGEKVNQPEVDQVNESYVKIFDHENVEFVAGWNVDSFNHLRYLVKSWFTKPDQLVFIVINKETKTKQYLMWNQF